MNATTRIDSDLSAIRSDLSTLKGDVATLIEHFKDKANGSVQDLSDPITAGIRCVSKSTSAVGERTTTAIDRWAERQPFLALGVGLGVGCLGALVLSRRATLP